MTSHEAFTARFIGETETINGVRFEHGRFFDVRFARFGNGWMWFRFEPIERRLFEPCNVLIPYSSICTFLMNWEVLCDEARCLRIRPDKLRQKALDRWRQRLLRAVRPMDQLPIGRLHDAGGRQARDAR